MDSFGRVWPQGTEVCPECGQPDNCGDCNHKPLTNAQARELGAEVSMRDRYRAGEDPPEREGEP